MSDLLDLLADLDPQPSPTWDVLRGYRPQYERCPDCGSISFGPQVDGTRALRGGPSKVRYLHVEGHGHLTLNGCYCGRYRYASWLPYGKPSVDAHA